MATLYLGSARCDENGGISGGAAGDQTKKEVSTQTFYVHSKGWYILRPKSADVAKKLATAMKEACDNDNIGYDQNQRGTLLTQFKNTKSIKAITTKCETDCSALVRVCIYQATGTLLSDFTTSNEASVLEASGLFESKKKYVSQSSTPTYDGDVVVTCSKGHTCIQVSGRARSGSSSSSSSSSGSTSSSGSSSSSKLSVDGEIGTKTVTKLQKVMGTTQDGVIDGQDSKQKKYWTSINSAACKWTGGTSAVVKALQKFLINKGYSCGSAGADGELGKDSAKALQKFLIAKGYNCGSAGADGEFGSSSAKALQNYLNAQ